MQNWNGAGIKRLYLPNLFSHFGISNDHWNDFHATSGLRKCSPNDFPIVQPGVQGMSFPLAPPNGMHFFPLLHTPPSLRIERIVPLPARTRDDSRTSIAPSIDEMSHQYRLHQVRCSTVLWSNLVSYANGTGVRNTFNENEAIATRGSQTRAIFALQGWFQKKLHQAQHLVNSEPDMQDIIYDELINFANEVFRVRLHCYKILNSGSG